PLISEWFSPQWPLLTPRRNHSFLRHPTLLKKVLVIRVPPIHIIIPQPESELYATLMAPIRYFTDGRFEKKMVIERR
ncbi:hypothetical protein PENTCL1PPCAC_6256, partial [Pristionchus entomophagus]